MKLLALDTATEACSAALFVDGAVHEQFEVIGRGHAERLLPMADDLLAEAGLRIGLLDAIAFGRGPGGFTGLRIAAGVAQGLAAGAGLPVLPVSNLEAIAAAARHAAQVTRVLVCMDARMGQVYWAAIDCSGPRPFAVTEEALSDPDSVTLPGELSWHAAGSGIAAYPVICERLGPRWSGASPELLPHAADIARLAASDFAAGKAVDPRQAQPVYLRNEVVHRR